MGESAQSPEATIEEANETEGEQGEQDSASVTGSDYSHEGDDDDAEDSEADDGRSNFGADSDNDGGDVKEADKDEEGDVTMRLCELSKTPSRETPTKQGERRTSGRGESRASPSERRVHTNGEDEEYLSELSEDEAFAASLA